MAFRIKGTVMFFTVLHSSTLIHDSHSYKDHFPGRYPDSLKINF